MTTETRIFPLEITGLAPDPLETWQRLRQFLLLDEAAVVAMRHTSEVLLQSAAQFVVDTYDYLARFDETASVLGWEQKMDEAHLRERRQFFATWLARTIGVDFSDEFAAYLFRAGIYHAGHGPRQIHTPDLWVLGSIGHVQAHFAGQITAAFEDKELVTAALGGWNKYLLLQLHLMQAGYQAACAIGTGQIAVEIRLFGRLRELAGREKQVVKTNEGAPVAEPLRKFFDYHPRLRDDILVGCWRSPDGDGAATWVTDFERVYVPREGPDWRLLFNGKDLRFHGGLETAVKAGDVISLFPPGR